MDRPDQRVAVTAKDGRELTIAPIPPHLIPELFAAFSDAVERGDGYPQTPPLARDEFDSAWIRPARLVVAATHGGRLAGAYYLKPNQPGLGAHIANAGYLVERAQRGGGVGRILVEDSILRAPLVGFDAIQFNFVFADNPARPMYEELGWRVIGQVPEAVGPGRDAVIYWRAVP